MKIKHEAVLEIQATTTFGQILQALCSAGVPDEARIRVEHHQGNPRDPSYTHLILVWED